LSSFANRTIWHITNSGNIFLRHVVGKFLNNDKDIDWNKDADHDLRDHLDPKHPYELDLGGSG